MFLSPIPAGSPADAPSARPSSAGDTCEPSPWYRFAIQPVVDPSLGAVEGLLAETLAALAARPASSSRVDAGTPEVSVIITAFHCGVHLRASVDSLLRQSIADIEIIIVDDCSTDDTYAVACELAAQDGRVRATRTATNAGTYVAKNLGLLQARGRFVTFQDSDDISHIDRLQRQLEPLQRDPDLVATTCHYCRVDESSGELLLNRGAKSRAGLISLMFHRERVTHAIGFFDSVRVNADDEFKTRLKRAFGPRAILELEDCLYFALLRAEGLTVAGHTANNLASSNLKSFLAPVRQRYTESFLAWHKSTPPGSRLFIDFPGLARPFPAPLSIDPMAVRRARRCTVLVSNVVDADALGPLADADPALLVHVDQVVVASPRFLGSEAPQQALETLPGQLPAAPVPLVAMAQDASPDRLFKEAADQAGEGVLIIAVSSSDIAQMPVDALRRALYLLYRHNAPPTAVVCQQGRVMVLHLDSLPVASFRIPKDETSLTRGVLRQAVARGVQVEFVR